MKFEELLILLPCHSLEDFPVHHEGDDAAGLLAAWTALWHPALIHAASVTPTWARADDPPKNLANKLVVVPRVSEGLLLAGWQQRAKDEGACVVRGKADRGEIVAAALAALQQDASGGEVAEFDPELVQDFLALGYAYLQEELLTRQMRYMSNLDEVHFKNQSLAAARAAAAGDGEECHRRLQSCFDVLTESRERFYPAQAYLIDLTLVAPTTIGASLRQELACPTPRNVLINGEALTRMAAEEPATLAAVRQAVESKTATIIGGEWGERELPLLPPEVVLAELLRGRETFERHLGQPPRIFGRRRFGLSPLLPQWLARVGFSAALTFTLDDGKVPGCDQSKTRWEGVDSSTIAAMTRVPVDIQQAGVFLSLCQKMGERMDMDHVATMTFAHWPGQSSPWYDDLRRIARYAPVLGRFVTLQEYFEFTESSGGLIVLKPDQFRSPYLKQSIIRRVENPLSRVAREHEQQLARLHAEALETLTALLTNRSLSDLRSPGFSRSADGDAKEEDRLKAELQTFADVRSPGFSRSANGSETEEDRLKAGLQTFAACLPKAGGSASGCLLVNPHSFTRKMCVELPGFAAPPDLSDTVKAAQGGERPAAVVEVPPLGYAWIAPGKNVSPKRRGETPMADPKALLLRNEFCELIVDPHTGALRALHDYTSRGNRMSAQVALRRPGPRPKPGDEWRDPDDDAEYSVMAADDVRVTASGPALAQIVSRGRLLDREGARLAGYQQTIQVWRGSRIIVLDIELDPDEEPRADPWNSYYAVRFAWADEGANLYRSLGWTKQPTDLKRIESPYFVEARSEKKRLAFLTGGLPYHRQSGARMLDTMLHVRGETRRAWRLGIAVDHPQPLQAAIELLSPSLALFDQPSPQPPTSWLFHLDAKNLLATHWEPLVEDDRVRGFVVRIQETDGRAGKAKLRCFRQPQSARQVDFLGGTLAQLEVQDDAVVLDFGAFEWLQVQVEM